MFIIFCHLPYCGLVDARINHSEKDLPVLSNSSSTRKHLLEMSSSWNFPARASPSYEGSEPSRAKLGHFNVRAENELRKILGPN